MQEAKVAQQRKEYYTAIDALANKLEAQSKAVRRLPSRTKRRARRRWPLPRANSETRARCSCFSRKRSWSRRRRGCRRSSTRAARRATISPRWRAPEEVQRA